MLFYRPEESVLGDVIPYCEDGTFYLFYLRDFRNPGKYGEGVPWYLLKTRDFLHFEELGEAVERGGSQDQDLCIFTGSLIQKDGKYYIFYTGHNHRMPEAGKPMQAVMMAVGEDLTHFQKVPDFKLFAPDFLEKDDFRDPFVFYRKEDETYYMLLAARKKEGPARRRGCTAIAASKDLMNWEVSRKPFYEPDHYVTHECPDLFQMGDWWYLVFSEYSDRYVTHYRMARNWNGPFLTPEADTFDNRAFYAAKTVSDGENRYIIGWNPTQENDEDYGTRQWGGNLVVHQLVQRPDGTLWVKAPEVKNRALEKEVKEEQLIPDMKLGRKDGLNLKDWGRLSGASKISFSVSWDENAREFYLFLGSDEEHENSYYIRFDISMGRIHFDSWPRKEVDLPYMPWLERKADLDWKREHQVEIFVENQVLALYFDQEIAMSVRMNRGSEGLFGAGAMYGEVSVKGIKVTKL